MITQVDTEGLRRILSELPTAEIIALVDGFKEHLAYKQTAYQLKPVEERGLQGSHPYSWPGSPGWTN